MEEIQSQFPCHQCGASLKFKPASKARLECPYCGALAKVQLDHATVQELSFEDFIAQGYPPENLQEVLTATCKACAAQTIMPAGVVATECPFCATSLIKTSESNRLLKPQGLLPFKIESALAIQKFRDWLKGLWFAPRELKTQAFRDEKLQGIYVPYWTYDADTFSDYEGERGDAYYETETYTETVHGQSVTRTRQVRRIAWTWVSGKVAHTFDDVLVLATQSLPEKYTTRLEPWDLGQLTSYDDAFVSGFRAESYQIGPKESFERAKQLMDAKIRSLICADIGGDEQRIHSVNTRYEHTTFKHLLLPVWVSAYRFRKKLFRFLVNGRTGEVQGERPWSAVKIALWVALILVLIGTLIYFFSR